MASPAIRRDTLTFEDNVVYELVLKYPTGKVISNGNVMIHSDVFPFDSTDMMVPVTP